MLSKQSLILLSALCGLGLTGVAAPSTATADGPALFKKHLCAKCHSAPGIEGGKTKLPKPGVKRTPEWNAQWLRKEIKVDGKTHKKPFKGPEADLKALAQWLSTLQ